MGEMFFIIQAVIALVISFFVLLGVSKTDSIGLRTFGRILAFTLWVIAVYLIVFALYGCCLQCVFLHKKDRICYHKIGR